MICDCRSTLSFAEWDDILQKAIVVEKKGPHWLHIGHSHGNKIYIYPEEALYLMEIVRFIYTPSFC